ncbi:MAG: PmoA family protein, partial [Armatimonadota bacterium]
MSASAKQLQLTVSAGPHDRRQCPLTADVPLPEGFSPEALACTAAEVTPVGGGQPLPGQFSVAGGGEGVGLTFLLDELAAGQTRDFVVTWGGQAPSGVRLKQTGEAKLSFVIADEAFTTYNYGRDLARPNLYPVYGPGGVEVTNYAPSDHVHHKSIYVAHGEVNGHDNWAEGKGHASTVHRELTRSVEGPVFAELEAASDWQTTDGGKLMEELTAIRMYNLPEQGRLLDFDVRLTASEGRVEFGDTKESGTLSVRVAAALEVPNGGTITNSFGGTNEPETWGKRAHWCDYSGEIGGRATGIAVFDHPKNFRHPTYWHVRDYGLMTANCWGVSAFESDQSRSGAYTFAAGETLRFRYRVYVHAGDVRAADVTGKYLDYFAPPG